MRKPHDQLQEITGHENCHSQAWCGRPVQAQAIRRVSKATYGVAGGKLDVIRIQPEHRQVQRYINLDGRFMRQIDTLLALEQSFDGLAPHVHIHIPRLNKRSTQQALMWIGS